MHINNIHKIIQYGTIFIMHIESNCQPDQIYRPAQSKSSLTGVTTTRPLHHISGSSLPRLITIRAHHHKDSSPSGLITIRAHHHQGSSPSGLITTRAHHHQSSSPPGLINLILNVTEPIGNHFCI